MVEQRLCATRGDGQDIHVTPCRVLTLEAGQCGLQPGVLRVPQVWFGWLGTDRPTGLEHGADLRACARGKEQREERRYPQAATASRLSAARIASSASPV